MFLFKDENLPYIKFKCYNDIKHNSYDVKRILQKCDTEIASVLSTVHISGFDRACAPQFFVYIPDLNLDLFSFMNA